MSFARGLTGFVLLVLSLAGGIAARAVAEPHRGPVPATATCDRYLALARTCQPRERDLTGRVFCPGYWCEAPSSRGARCVVRLYVRSWDPPPPTHTIEVWWSLWSDADRRRYYIYDGTHNVLVNTTREFTFCDLSCGLRLEGLVWRDLQTWSRPEWERVDADVVESPCVDCREPTPTLSPRSLTPPSPRGCQWRAWLPVTVSGRP